MGGSLRRDRDRAEPAVTDRNGRLRTKVERPPSGERRRFTRPGGGIAPAAPSRTWEAGAGAKIRRAGARPCRLIREEDLSCAGWAWTRLLSHRAGIWSRSCACAR